MPSTATRRIRRSLGAVALLFAIWSSARPETIRARVIGIQDGDTITVLDSHRVQYRIRLAGIDAPEKSQAFGAVSKRNLSALVFSRDVEVHTTKTDRYGRLVGKVVENGRDVCLEQLRSGLAWLYTDYEKELAPKDQAAYAAAQREARSSQRGLWNDPAPLPPWQFRRNSRAPRSRAPSGKVDAQPTNVVGNKRSGIYHLPNCPGFAKVSPANREYFWSEAAAVAAGYRKAKNCG